jgi:hypothetical protein
MDVRRFPDTVHSDFLCYRTVKGCASPSVRALRPAFFRGRDFVVGS